MDMPVEFALFFRYLQGMESTWILTVIIGLFAGVIARAMSSGPRNHNLLSTLAIGVSGAGLGVWTADWLGIAIEGPGRLFLFALGGSLLLVWLFNTITRPFRRPDDSGVQPRP